MKIHKLAGLLLWRNRNSGKAAFPGSVSDRDLREVRDHYPGGAQVSLLKDSCIWWNDREKGGVLDLEGSAYSAALCIPGPSRSRGYSGE